MLSVIMLSVIMLSVIKLSVIMLSVIMLSVIMLNVIMLSVVAPLKLCVPSQNIFWHKIRQNISIVKAKMKFISAGFHIRQTKKIRCIFGVSGCLVREGSYCYYCYYLGQTCRRINDGSYEQFI